MYLDEAIAVYLYLQHVPPKRRGRCSYTEAWNVICRHAERALREQALRDAPRVNIEINTDTLADTLAKHVLEYARRKAAERAEAERRKADEAEADRMVDEGCPNVDPNTDQDIPMTREERRRNNRIIKDYNR